MNNNIAVLHIVLRSAPPTLQSSRVFLCYNSDKRYRGLTLDTKHMIIVYITAPNKKEANRISKVLINKKLVACVNIWPIESAYCWKNKMVSEKEVVLLCKTRKGNFEKVKKAVKKIHSYEVPCIISWSVDKADKEYMDWIRDETNTMSNS